MYICHEELAQQDISSCRQLVCVGGRFQEMHQNLIVEVGRGINLDGNIMIVHNLISIYNVFYIHAIVVT